MAALAYAAQDAFLSARLLDAGQTDDFALRPVRRDAVKMDALALAVHPVAAASVDPDADHSGVLVAMGHGFPLAKDHDSQTASDAAFAPAVVAHRVLPQQAAQTLVAPVVVGLVGRIAAEPQDAAQ
ncbi:MAG: hypothetical protein NVS9B14_05530 [Candidatus Acidiferrum sp.]